MKRGISVEREFVERTPGHYNDLVTVAKKRGRLTLEEVQDALRDYDLNNQNRDLPFYGTYAIILKCNEEMGDGFLFDFGDPDGDAVTLYPLRDQENCPVCNAVLPDFERCPHCGGKLVKR